LSKVAIWGCRDGLHVLQEINRKASEKYDVVAFCDNGEKYKNTLIENVPVVSFDELVQSYQDGTITTVIVAVRKGYSRFCIIKQLQGVGIEKIILVKPYVLTYKKEIVFDEKNPLFQKQWLDVEQCAKPIIHHLEINVADGCNLNCRGCLHFSNLYGRDEFPDHEELLTTIKEIAKHTEIFQFRVLGGEPLLYDELPEFLERLREILPNTDLAVISNGILIPKYDERLYKVMNENHIGFNLTLYEPTLKMKELIYSRLDEYNVAYGSHESKCEKFEKFLCLEPRSAKAFENCEPRGILVVKDKKLYRCPIEAYINRFYETYNIALNVPEGIDIFDDGLVWNELVEDLYMRERPLCKYCAEQSEYYEWNNGKPEKVDWLIE